MNATAQSKLLVNKLKTWSQEIVDSLLDTEQYIYLYTEADLKCMFFQKLRARTASWRGVAGGDTVPLVHAEYRTKPPTQFYDIAVWHPQCAEIVRDFYGKVPDEFVPAIQVLAAIELKLSIKPINTFKQVDELLQRCDKDLQKLEEPERGGYMVVFIPPSWPRVLPKNNGSFQRLKKGFQDRVNHSQKVEVLIAGNDDQISRGRNWEWIV